MIIKFWDICIFCTQIRMKSRRVAIRNLCARSVVRLIEAIKEPEPETSPNVILKPKDVTRHLPGTRLLIKIAKKRDKEKEKRKMERAAPEIDQDEVEDAIEGILADLEA